MDRIIVLFGAGINGKRILDEIQTRFSGLSLLFCDNDTKKHDTKYKNINIVEFQRILEFYNNGKIKKIILTMQDSRETFYQCIAAGIHIDFLYYWDSVYDTYRPIWEKYSKMIYAQDGEEIFLKDFFGHKNNGIYIDIGANHPFRFSNTHWAYTKGWKGINIEPDIVNFELLKSIRNRDININCGISDEEIQLDYYILKESALNTFCINEIKNKDDIVDVRKVPLRRLDNILDEYNIKKVDYIDIDVEGMELRVLNSINWDVVEIGCILIEQKGMSLDDVLESQVCSLLKSRGYVPMNKYNRTVIYILKSFIQ